MNKEGLLEISVSNRLTFFSTSTLPPTLDVLSHLHPPYHSTSSHGADGEDAGCHSARRDDFEFMTRLGNGADREGGGRGSGWEGDVEAQTRQRISLFEKCLYLRSRWLSPPLIACASSGLAMFTGKVGRRREGVEEERQEDRLQRKREGRDEA